MKNLSPTDRIARLFRSLSQPERVLILLTIGPGEACVCHLEALLGLRQAYISQHLMALRQAGILSARRDGRYIFYRLADPQLLLFLHQAASLAGLPPTGIPEVPTWSGKACCCPNCLDEAVQHADLPSQLPVISS